MSATQRDDEANPDTKSISRASDDAIARAWWVYEDELPRLTDSEYAEWFQHSAIVDGVRMGPMPVLIGGRRRVISASEARASTSRSSTDADGNEDNAGALK